MRIKIGIKGEEFDDQPGEAERNKEKEKEKKETKSGKNRIDVYKK